MSKKYYFYFKHVKNRRDFEKLVSVSFAPSLLHFQKNFYEPGCVDSFIHWRWPTIWLFDSLTLTYHLIGWISGRLIIWLVDLLTLTYHLIQLLNLLLCQAMTVMGVTKYLSFLWSDFIDPLRLKHYILKKSCVKSTVCQKYFTSRNVIS